MLAKALLQEASISHGPGGRIQDMELDVEQKIWMSSLLHENSFPTKPLITPPSQLVSLKLRMERGIPGVDGVTT